jgi:hypothetical protein
MAKGERERERERRREGKTEREREREREGKKHIVSVCDQCVTADLVPRRVDTARSESSF